ncbi:MAG TPA: methyltransferase domain-containing protein [Chthoniobacterales bacterium]|nr:methyltransferase domain-containing protein [Chthoniobacterales bacterium]
MKRTEPQPEWPQSWKDSYFYDRSEIYGEISHYGYAYAYEKRRRETLRLISEVLSPGASVLDIAAAQGNFSLALAELGFEVTWNDLRTELADYVRSKHERGQIHFAPGNAFELGFPSLFDAVLITEIIEHVAHPDDFLVKAAALVKPGGYVVMTTPNGGYFKNTLPKFSECADPAVFESVQFKPNADGHIFLLHTDEIEPLARRAGLTLDKIALFTNPLTAGHMKTEGLLKILPRGVVSLAEGVTGLLPGGLKKKLLVQMAARFRKA